MSNVTYAILACYPDKGMKSYGSKSLMSFNEHKLLDHQINTINTLNKNNTNYEIVVISSFDTVKLNKNFINTNIIHCEKYNPVFAACSASKYSDIVFIDYGCIFNTKTLANLRCVDSSILCCETNKNNDLNVGCILDTDNNIVNMFLDLPNHKFCNMFYLNCKDTNKILRNDLFKTKNLLYFEIINLLISHDSVLKAKYISNTNFIYFNNMRQKNAICKFFK